MQEYATFFCNIYKQHCEERQYEAQLSFDDACQKYRDTCQEIIVWQNQLQTVSRERRKIIEATKNRARDILGLSPRSLEENNTDFYQLWYELRTDALKIINYEMDIRRKNLDTAIATQLEIAEKLSKFLPEIRKEGLKPDCLYRGALMRNVNFYTHPTSPDDGFQIIDLCFLLEGNHNNSVAFTGLKNQFAAIEYAIRGYVDDHRSRKDAVIIELPQEIAEQHVDITTGQGRYLFPRHSFQADLLHLYRPVADT